MGKDQKDIYDSSVLKIGQSSSSFFNDENSIWMMRFGEVGISTLGNVIFLEEIVCSLSWRLGSW